MPARIEDYALIGDCETAALVSRDGSIDWLCWPRFDSGACFAALLGTPQHGFWKIAPAGAVRSTSRRYRKGTLILETEFETEQGKVAVIDFMPVRGMQSNLIRIIQGLRGEVEMEMKLVLRFDYGQSVPWMMRLDDGSLRAIAGPNMAVLRTSVPIRGEDLTTVSEFTVQSGKIVSFVLSYGPSHLPVPEPIDPQGSLESTEAFWQEWSARCKFDGRWAEPVRRSLITLKALSYLPTGGITAAATTSLPEKIGGGRNWDYRFCWLRDATFTLQVLLRAGYMKEASDWQDWLLRAVAGSPDQVQIMYGLAGERILREWEVDWLPGYEGSNPVRIGNAASEQLQLDIYGEIGGVLHHGRRLQLRRSKEDCALEWNLLEHLEKIWREPDEGIWEVRGPRQQFTHSKVMAWVAFDRAIKSSEEFGLEGPVDRWRAVRQEIHDEVCDKGFDPVLDSFVQSYGSKNLDASLLMIPKAGFLPASDARVQGTIRAIERHLLVDGFVLRYNTHETDDGLPPGEGVFLPCSFWLADVYALSGRYDQAEKMFESLLSLPNDVGLLSEEYDPVEKRFLGNFPQAFSHVALASTAYNLARVAREAGKESNASGPPSNRTPDSGQQQR